MFIFHCFNQNFKDSETSRMVYREPSQDAQFLDDVKRLRDHPSEGGVRNWVDHLRREEGPMPDWSKRDHTTAALDTLGTTVEAKKDRDDLPHPVPPKAKDKLIIRTKIDIFGDKETQDRYLKTVQEKLETLSEGDLYKFIMDHQSYDKQDDHRKWNEDFARLLGLAAIPADYPEEYKKKTDLVTHYRRVTTAAQIKLVEYYQSKGDVFQVNRAVVNPWIFIDGKMGPYTISVLAEYWKSKYGKESKKAPPTRAHLGMAYKPESAEFRTYAATGPYLDGQLSGRRLANETPEGTPADAKVRAQYEKLDRKKEAVQNSDLVIAEEYVTADMTLSEALADAYGEDVKPVPPVESPKLFRTLNLLAKKIGAKINSHDMNVKQGDFIEISAQGLFTITREDKIVQSVNLWGNSAGPVPGGKEPDKTTSVETDEQVRKRLADLDVAGDSFYNATELPLNHSLKKNYATLELAMAEVYTSKGNKKDAYVNRVLNLLAKKYGASIKTMAVEAGDTIEIKADGTFSIIKSDGTVRYIPVKIFS